MKNKNIEFQISNWFKDFRPEVLALDRQILTDKAYDEVISDVDNVISETGKTLFLHEFLKLNYLQSAYNLIKDVFSERFNSEYNDYLKTPIFYEVNEEILGLALFHKVFESYDQIFDDSKFYDKDFRDKIEKLINEVII